MGKSRLKVSRIDGRRYRYPYPVYFRPPLRWITSSLTAKKVAVVARDFGPQILRAIHQNDLDNLQRILERRLKADFLITRLCMMDVGQNVRSTRESCPLIVAAQKKDPMILQYMLEKGADPNYVETRTARDPYRFCAVHAAVRRGLLKTTSVLLDAKADPNVADSRGDTPVHMATRADDCAMVKLLLSRSADPNAKDKHGNTPLHIATSHGNLEIISLLLGYGAHLNVPNQQGEFPIHIAAFSGHAHLLSALSVPNANVPSVIKNVMQYPLHLAAENGNANVVQALLESGAAEVGVKDSNGNTVLHRLVLNPYEYSTMKDMNYFIGTALALLKAGVDVNELNTRGETALSLASSNRFPAVAKLIHASGKKEFSLEPEMVKQILIKQNIISPDNLQENVKNHMQDSSRGSPSGKPPVPPKINPVASSGNVSKSLLVDKNGGPNREKQPVLGEAGAESNQKKGDSAASTQPELSNEELKRYPLRKSDLWNYQQFQSSPKQQSDVSSFSVNAKKQGERMCIVFDKTSPNTQKPSDSTSQKWDAERESQTKRSRSADAAKPFTKRSTSAENKVQDNAEKNQAQRLSTSELRQLDSDVKQEKWESYFYPGKAKSEQALRSTDDRANEDEEDVWLEHQVGRYMTASPVALKDLFRDPQSGLRHYSKSPSGFLSEGGGLRRLKLRVAGEVPKAYTCRGKAAARKAFILAKPVGIENVGDFDRGHLSMSSLPELGGEAWERAMQRRAEWTEPPKPIFTKYGSLTSTEFPAATNVTPPQPNKIQQLDYRIAGLCPQPYKSFGKIETKTDAIEEALLDYETEEEYEIDDDDLEPGMGESFDEKAPHEWHLMDQEPGKRFDKAADYVNQVTNLDISLNDSLSSIEADVIAERILKELQDAKENEDAMRETPTLIEDAQNNERNAQRQARTEYDKYNSQNVDSRVPSGKANSSVLLNLLHGYHPRRNKYETMVVSSVEPEVQRLTADNIVIAESSNSDDEQDSDISADETKAVPQTVQTKADLGTMEGRRKADELQNKHIDKEVEQRMRTGKTDIPVQIFETVSAVQEPDRENIYEENGTADSVNRNLKSKKMVVDTDDNKYANEIGATQEAGEKKPKKGKRSSKKQAITEDAAGNEDAPYIDSAEVKGSQKKPKTKSKNKRKQEEPEEPASGMQQPETPVGLHVDPSNEEVLYSSYSEEPGKRRHSENDRLSDTNDREKGKDSDHDTYPEESGRRKKTGHGRQYPSKTHDASSSIDALEKDSQEFGKENLKKMKPKHKEADTGNEPLILPVYNEEQRSQSIGKDGSGEALPSAKELDISKGLQELQNELDVNTVADDDVVVGKTQTKRKKRKEVQVMTDDSAKEVGKSYEPETGIIASVEESSNRKQRTLRDADSKTYDEDDKENEILDVEAANNKSKQEARKRKKKVRDKLEDANEQNLDIIQDEHSMPTGNESIDDSVSRETDSIKILSQSSDSDPVKVGSGSVKKGKRSKSITKDQVSKDTAWNTGAIHEEVWQEAMREEPLASSETIYDAMKLNDAKAQKKSKSASSKEKRRKDGLARDGFPTDQISSEFTGDEISQTSNWIDSQTADVLATSHPSRPVKETDIDDEIADWENYANSAYMTDENFQSFGMKTPDREHRTMETSVDDIMDEIEDVKEVVAERVAALYHRSNEINIPPSSGDAPLHISSGAEKQTPIETNIDDDYEENPPYPEAEEFESAVEKSLETNIDDFIEEFSSVASKENSISDIDKYNRLNVRDPFATSRASKVTNIDDFQVEALASEQLGQNKQTDLTVPSGDDANLSNEVPVSNESLKKPLGRKGSKKKSQKGEKHHEPEERVDVTEPKDESIESSEIVPQPTKTRKGQKKKKGQNQLEDTSQQENHEELLVKHQKNGKQHRPAKETSIDDDIYLSCEDELRPVDEQVIGDKNCDSKNQLNQEMDETTETSEGRESYLDHNIKTEDQKQKRIADYLKIKRYEESESIESEHDLQEDVESIPKTFSLGTDATKKQKEKAQVKRSKEAQEDLEKLVLEDEYRRQKKTKKHNKEVGHVQDKRASNVEFQRNEETSLAQMDDTETVDDEAAEDILGMKKKQEETEEAYHEDSEQDEEWSEKITSDKDWHETIIPEDIQSKKVASAKSQLERFVPSDEGENDAEEDAKHNAPKTFSLDAVGGKKPRGKSITDEQKIQAEVDDFEEYKRAKKTKKHRKDVDNTTSKNEIKSYEEKEEESVLSGKDSSKIPAREESANIQVFKKKGKQAKDKDSTETDEYTQEEILNKKVPYDRKQLEKFIPDDNSEDDEEEKEAEGNALKTFIPGNRNTKNVPEKTPPEEKKGTELLPSDEFEEYRRNKKTRKHPKGLVNTADKIRPHDEKPDKKIKAEGDSESKKFDKLKTGIKQAEETVLREVGQDEDWHEDEIREVRSEKFNAVKKELQRFSVSDESEEEEEEEEDDEDDLEDDEHKAKSFGKDAQSGKKMHERPSAAQEAELIEENEQYKRHTKPKRPMLKTLYDQDVSEENEKVPSDEAEKFAKKDGKKIDLDRGTARPKDAEHKKSKKIGSSQEEQDDSSDEQEEFEEKKQKRIPSVKRYEEATASDESEDDSQGNEKNKPKSFNISAAAGVKKSEKNIVDNKNEIIRSAKDDQADDFEDFQRRKKPKRPVLKAGPTETNIDADLDERELKSTQIKPLAIQTNLDELSTDEESGAENVPVLQQKLDKIKKLDKEFVSDGETDEEFEEEEEEEEEDNVPKTFVIGDKRGQKIVKKQTAKDTKKEVDKFAVTKGDSTRKRQAADGENKMSWKNKTESETDEEESDEDRTEYDKDKLPKKRFELSRFKEDSSFSKESDDNQENVNILPDILPVKIIDKKNKMEKNIIAKHEGKYSNSRTGSKKENEWKNEESDEDEEIEEIPLKNNIKEIGRNNERNLKHHPATKDVGRTSQSQEDEEESEETSNKDVESEEVEIFEHRRRTKSARDRHANKPAPDVQKGGLHFTAASQQQKIVSETNFDNLSGSEYSGENDEKITAKIESLLSHKKPFSKNEDEVESDEPSLIKDDDIAKLVETSTKETSKQMYRTKENMNKKNLQETSIDDDTPYDPQRKTQNVRDVNGVRENIDVTAKKQQERNKQERRTFETTDDSEEVGESFSRNQLGRVSRVRQKKGTRKTIAALDASSNADTEGESTEDSRRRSAGVPGSKKWTTKEQNQVDTEITNESTSRQTSTPNSASFSQKPPSSISPLSDNDSSRRVSSLKGKMQEGVKSKVPARVPNDADDASNDLDASIRQKRRMEMTDTITTKTVTTTKTTPDSKTTGKQTDENLYSLPNRSNRQPPKTRDIQSMGTTSDSAAQETTFDFEPLPGTNRGRLDMSLPENLLSKNESLKRVSLDASLLRKSTAGEQTSQDRTRRQHSAESLPHQQNRSRSSEFEGKTQSDANFTRRRPHSTRSRSTSNLDSRVSYGGSYRTQRESGQQSFSMRQPNKSLTQVAFETIAANSVNERHLMKKILSEKPVVYTRGIYRPQPVYWRGSSRGGNPNDESRIYNRPDVEQLGIDAANDDLQNKTGDSLDISRQNGVLESSPSSPPQFSATMEGDGDDSEKRNSAFAAYNKRVTIREDQQQQQQRQFYVGNRRQRSRHHRSSRSPRPESYKAPRITEPNAVDFSKYGLVAQIWMEQVDMKTVLKSKTMYLTIMPEGVQPPDKITKSLKYEPTGDDLTLPPQWIIARGRTFRQQKRQLDEYRYRMSEGHNLSDSELDLSRSGRPMSPGGRQELLFFKVGGRWPELAWVLFEGVQTDSATVRMVKDIQLKNPSKLTDQIQDMMTRWWKQKGEAATIEELKRSLDIINIPFIQDETFNPRHANSFFEEEPKLTLEEVDSRDPDVSRMIQEYNLNASFHVDQRGSPRTPQAFSSDALLLQTQLKGLETHSSPNLRHSRRVTRTSEGHNDSLSRSDSKDARNSSFRPFSSQDSIDAENVADGKRKSFTIVQSKPKNKGKKEKFGHESNI